LDGSLVDGFLVPEPDERLIFRGHSVLAELSVFVVLAVAFDFLQLVKAWRGGATARHRVNGELIPLVEVRAGVVVGRSYHAGALLVIVTWNALESASGTIVQRNAGLILVLREIPEGEEEAIDETRPHISTPGQGWAWQRRSQPASQYQRFISL
jgi:hypothetical protein